MARFDMIISKDDMIISNAATSSNYVQKRRLAHKWSQAELAGRAGISRAAISAIEGKRLSPSVATAIALARVFECSVEELFGHPQAVAVAGPEWAWLPSGDHCRYWEATVGGRSRFFPVEAANLNLMPHDGIWKQGVLQESGPSLAESTLVLASCDPAAGFLAAEFARQSGFRMIVLPRGGRAALDLLHQRLVHVAGIHYSTAEHPDRNREAARAPLGADCQLLRVAEWETGIAIPTDNHSRSAQAIMRNPVRWALREPGSAARECLDELLGSRRFSGRQVSGHAAVAEAVRSGWAGAGVCVRFAAAEAGLNFLTVCTESLDLCFPTASQHDPRIKALIRLLRTRSYRRFLSELPGYDARHTGDMCGLFSN